MWTTRPGCCAAGPRRVIIDRWMLRGRSECFPPESKTCRCWRPEWGENRASAVDMASGALIVAAADRGRAEYRVSLAGTELMVIPGLDRRGRSGPVHPPRDGVGH